MWRFRLVFFHFDQIMKLTLRVLSLPEETCILILDISVFSPLRSICVHQKTYNSHFWTPVFSCVFIKNTTFSLNLCFFRFFVFLHVFARAEQGDFNFHIFPKSAFAPSIWHLNAKYSQINHENIRFEYVS